MKEFLFLNWRRASLLNRFHIDQRGQVLPWTAFLLILMLGVSALALDFGRAYIAFHQLQSSADAAALAGAEQLPNSTATTWAQNYSAGSGDLNSYAWMGNVTVTVTPKCLTTLTGSGMACTAPSNANALQVTESVNLPTYFARLFGMNTIPVAFKSTAAMRGSTSIPYNVAIIVDTTASMASNDGDSQCGKSRLTCALQGVQVLLQNMAPCSSQLTTCTATIGGTNGAANVANPVDVVGLFTFPIPTIATVTRDYSCAGQNPAITPYQFPKPGDTSYAPAGPSGDYLTPSTQSQYNSTYEVVGFSSDYKTSASATTLNSTSSLVKAVGGVSGCPGMGDPGGEGTYYAGVIYAAQAALVAEKASTGRANSQNVIILLSDGDATSNQAQMGSTAGGATNSGTYPSWIDECHQAITAAQAAAAAGTRVYAVAYGATATGCGSDSPTITPCSTMEHIASSSQYFYSDYTASQAAGNNCVSGSQPTTNLNQIFFDIANDFTTARLIPNGTT